MKKHYAWFAIFIPVLLSACNNTVTQNSEKTTDTAANSTPAPVIAAARDSTWIDDFRNLRDAIYQRNVAKVETYFNFPLNYDESGISFIIQHNNPELSADTHSGTFGAADFERHYTNIFAEDFTKAILKIKSDTLYLKGRAETQELSGKERNYRLYASVDEEDQVLHLNLAYYNGYDENGEYVSEGEYNIIYIFRIINRRYLKFEKITMAG